MLIGLEYYVNLKHSCDLYFNVLNALMRWLWSWKITFGACILNLSWCQSESSFTSNVSFFFRLFEMWTNTSNCFHCCTFYFVYRTYKSPQWVFRNYKFTFIQKTGPQVCHVLSINNIYRFFKNFTLLSCETVERNKKIKLQVPQKAAFVLTVGDMSRQIETNDLALSRSVSPSHTHRHKALKYPERNHCTLSWVRELNLQPSNIDL